MAWAMSRQGHRVLMAAATGTATATATAAKRGRPAGILKVVPVSPSLGEFLGVSQVSRTEAVKKVWEYIKQNNLQNPSNKKQILCDAKLKTIFNGKDQVGFLEIAKLMSQHFTKS
ncbi:putative transcription regulator SWI/SNF-BAF60b family [Helianthus annuus]|nr:putative transcription regulator SWI/SNF-BAF60b family [Helianthus annuus]